MSLFYVTVGQKYRYEQHPVADWVHPDGYVVVEAEAWAEARHVVHRYLGQHWGFMYTEAQIKYGQSFDPAEHPLGETARIVTHNGPDRIRVFKRFVQRMVEVEP